ncbi:serine/threonine-protein phosphatase 6 regulatory ankyrin repeat subunit B isoform X1 [Tribolium castaneum]|uniref:Tankyrase-like Protein n=1 Tax=Tribolium castaneum TaxID=7070 RepID=A0A139WFV8_TRICA|nr:PREDICTED: serine/threonine-protein phosphatase 6 regulatory ankyrin repeat subunit B-like isoform X1 [Tribolium castaneum]KYB26769.1 Tankyrase-like Protein [Tribolium castaneum]|eukprot:XP_008195229.1 PREDICTED: serine/threonine-protein phosphatase 6 regulatory ankyrin repeat subunit B-like isoform X1 [Tribolium castaneum]
MTSEEKIADYEVFITTMHINLGWSPLHCMIEKKKSSLAQTLINQNVDINSLDKFRRSPLSIASAKNNNSLVEILLSSGAKVNRGFPLHYACEKNHVKIAQTLIENGADLNLERDSNYPLLIAINKGHIETAIFLLQNGADVHIVDKHKETALHWACDRGLELLIQPLINNGCDIDAKDRSEMTPLNICLVRQENRPDLVKLLIKNGALISLRDSTGCTYLHSCFNQDSLTEFLKHGLDPNLQDVNNETPLYSHSRFTKHDYCNILLEYGADPNIARKGGWTPLHVAASEGYLDYVKELIKHKASVNAASAQNITPLHLAAKFGHLEIVKELIKVGAFIDIPIIDLCDVNSSLPHFVDSEWVIEGQSPFDLATKFENFEICDFLIATRKNTSGSSLMGWTLLHHSVWSGFVDLPNSAVVNVCDKFGRTPLSLAAAKNNSDIVKKLHKAGGDVDLGLPLHFAVRSEALDCVSLLLDLKCDVNKTSNHEFENTPLLDAIYESKINSAMALIRHKIDVNCTNKWGETPLELACRYTNLDLAKELLNCGACVNSTNFCKETPLNVAALFKNIDILSLLIGSNSDVNFRDHFDCTPLHSAVGENFEAGVLKLVKAGAAVNVCNDDFETPLILAVDNANLNVTKILIDHNSDVNFQTPEGWSALHTSVYCGNLNCVKELLKSGAEVNVASSENVLPIYLAAIKGWDSVVEELLDRGSLLDPYIFEYGVFRDDTGSFSKFETYHIVAGNTPLLGGCAKGHLGVVKLLESRGASLNCVNSWGNNVLHEAVLSQSVEVVEFLLGLNADFNVGNKSGKTPLDLAKEINTETIINLIINKPI